MLSCASSLLAQLELSDNPVRGDRVTLTWPASSANARIMVFGFTGERLHEATVAAPLNQYVWDLTVRGGTRRIVNGAYLLVVMVNEHRYRRRLFIARPNPAP